MSQSSVGRMLAGLTVPDAPKLARLADTLGVPRNEVLSAAGIVTDQAGALRPVTAPVSAEIIGKLRTLRKIQKVSAQMLADRMTELGYPIQRTVIANLENGRRAEVSIDHVLVAAQALGTTITDLLEAPVVCPKCAGEPPAGFTCNTCGMGGAPC